MTSYKSILVGTAFAAGAVLWYLFRPETLIVDRTVNEPLPMAEHSQPAMAEAPAMDQPTSGMAEPRGMEEFASAMAESRGMARAASRMSETHGMASPTSEMAESRGMAPSAPGMADPSAMVHPAMSSPDPETLARGRFHSNAHETKGLATVVRLEDGRRLLRLTEFATSNGPDVRVYLVAAADVQDEAAAKEAGFVDLGELKGNLGDQNYEIPADLDLSKYRAVSIWCRRFSVNFGAAPLEVSN